MAEDFFRDKAAELALQIEASAREKSPWFCVGISVDHIISYMDDKLAKFLGYNGVHKTLIGQDFGVILGDGAPPNHAELLSRFIREGRPGRPLNQVGNMKRRHFHSNGEPWYENVPCSIDIDVVELGATCRGLCSIENASDFTAYGFAYIRPLETKAPFIRNALRFQEVHKDIVARVEQAQEALAQVRLLERRVEPVGLAYENAIEEAGDILQGIVDTDSLKLE